MKSPTGHRHNRITPPERADQLISGDVPLCDPALGAGVDLTRIEAALKRLDIGSFGYCWGYFPPAALSTSGPTTSFTRTDKTLAAVEVHACSACASTTHWVRTDAFKREHGTDDMVGVNMRLFDPDELSGIEVQFPDGKNWDGNGAFGFRRDAIAIGEDTRW